MHRTLYIYLISCLCVRGALSCKLSVFYVTPLSTVGEAAVTDVKHYGLLVEVTNFCALKGLG